MKRKKQQPGRQAANMKATVTTVEALRPATKSWVLTQSYTRGILILILAIGAFLRVYRIDAVPHGLYEDEAADGNSALEAIETGHFQVFYPENHGREGLMINLSAACISLFGNTAWAVRLPTVIFGILNVWAVYLAATAFFDRPIALLAAFFTATSLWQVMASRFSNRANAAPFFLALAIYLLVDGVDRMRRGRPFILTMLLAGAIYGAGFHTYTSYRATPVLVGGLMVYWFFQARKDGWLKAYWQGALWFGGAAAVLVFPLALYFLQHPAILTERAAMVSVFNVAHPAQELVVNVWKMAQMFFFTGDANWRHNISGRRELFVPVAILFAIGIAVAVQAIRKSNRFPYVLMFAWIAVGVLPTVFTNDGIPHATRSSLIMPPVFMLVALGAYQAFSYLFRVAPRALGMAAGAILLVSLCYEPYHMYFDLWADNPNARVEFSASLVDAAAQINAIPKEVPKYIAVGRNTDLANGTPTTIGTIVYLTRSYTKKQQEAAGIHYVTPPRGVKINATTFCGQVVQQNPGARVFCFQ